MNADTPITLIQSVVWAEKNFKKAASKLCVAKDIRFYSIVKLHTLVAFITAAMGAICSTTVPVGTRLHWYTDWYWSVETGWPVL